MAYTIKQVSEISGVTVRALRHYHALGLLKPASVGANGYRYYERDQLLLLQQIRFYRRLGLGLQRIRAILLQPNFDTIAALREHRALLRKESDRIHRLVETIDKTLQHMKGKTKMKPRELFAGFDPEQQAKHEQYLIERYGEPMKTSIAESKRRVGRWQQKDWSAASAGFETICKDFNRAMDRRLAADSAEVQAAVRRHFEWLKQFWTPDRDSYAGHADLIVSSELRTAYERYDPRLPEFVADGIRVFARREL